MDNEKAPSAPPMVRIGGLSAKIKLLLVSGSVGATIFVLVQGINGKAEALLQRGIGQVKYDSLSVKPAREFAADSYVHRPLSANAEIDPRSDLWVRDLLRQIKTYYGAATVNIDKFSPPLYVVGPNHPTVRVKAARPEDPKWSFAPLQEKWDAVPLPDGFAAAQGTDGEAIVYQPSSGMYWEFWRLQKTGQKVFDSTGRKAEEWSAAWGGRIDDLSVNPGYFVTTAEGYKFGTAATGLALLSGLITIEDQRRGAIEHPLHFAIPETRERSIWAFPAQRSDGQIKNEDAIPEGVTFRLPADLNLDAIDMDPYARLLAKAVQKYGMVLRDVSGSVNFYAENPLNRYNPNPYFGAGGILRCPNNVYAWSCSSTIRLRGFPWDRLQALRARLNY